LGHAFEAATDFRKFKHGEGIAWGMIAVLEYSREVGLLPPKDAARLIQLIRSVGPLPDISRIPFESIWKALMRDKKFRKGDIRMVLLQSLGKAAIYNGIEAASLRGFLKRFIAGSRGLA
jgi:3-dehydroquinate synthase